MSPYHYSGAPQTLNGTHLNQVLNQQSIGPNVFLNRNSSGPEEALNRLSSVGG